MKEPKKIVLAPTFLKSLNKLANDSAVEDKFQHLLLSNDNLIVNQRKSGLIVFAKNVSYFPHWHELFKPGFNKKYTYDLAKAYQETVNCTLFSAKLQMSQFKWWDYEYFFQLIELFDEDTYSKLDKIYNIYDAGGYTRYKFEQNPAYQKQMGAYFDKWTKSGQIQKDGSVIMNEVKDKDKRYPLLKKVDAEANRKVESTELAQLEKKNAQILTSWLADHSQLNTLFSCYLNAWGHTFARYS